MEEARIETRPAGAGDARSILALQRLCYQDEARLYDDYEIPPLTQTLEGLGQDLDEQTVLVASDGEEIVGSVRGRLVDGVCRVGRLVVCSRLRRRGLGARLMQEIEARFPHAERYELFTGHLSEGNLRLYRRLGYVETRTEVVSPRLRLIFLEKPRSAP